MTGNRERLLWNVLLSANIVIAFAVLARSGSGFLPRWLWLASCAANAIWIISRQWEKRA